MSKDTALDLRRIGEQINVILTEIYGKYVAQGSPTKLGGLRFLDVESAKTFAFEKTRPGENGNLLILSAPFGNNKEEVEAQLKAGPHSDRLRDVVVRASSDAGKGNKFFVEAAYFLETPQWITNDAVTKIIEQHGCTGGEAVTRILKAKVLPIAADIMEYFIQIVRGETSQPSFSGPA